MACRASRRRTPAWPARTPGVTADQFAARHIGQDTRIPSLELCTALRGAQVAWRTPKQSLPQEGNPRAVFYRLFGQGDTDAERKAILDETGQLARSSQREVQSVGSRLSAARTERPSTITWLGARDRAPRADGATADTSALEIPDAPIGVPNDIVEHMKLMFDLMGLGVPGGSHAGHHALARQRSEHALVPESRHRGSVPSALASRQHRGQAREADRRFRTFHTQMFAGFVEKLASAAEKPTARCSITRRFCTAAT